MKHYLTILWLLATSFCAVAQTNHLAFIGRLERDLMERGISYHDVPNYKLIHDGYDYVCLDQDCPLKRLGTLTGKWTHTDGQCEVYLTYSPVYSPVRLLDSDSISTPSRGTLMRVKTDLRWGGRRTGVSSADSLDLGYLLHWMPARHFNASTTAIYPFNMEGKSCRGFTNVRVVVVTKGRKDLFIYFLLKEKASKSFESYLEDLKDMFTFKY